MALKDKIAEDNTRIFMNLDHFAEEHFWNGVRIVCVPDEELALKRKNNNVNDVSWDNNIQEILIHTPLEGFPGGEEPEPNTQVVFDRKTMWVRESHHNMGMLDILLSARNPREL